MSSRKAAASSTSFAVSSSCRASCSSMARSSVVTSTTWPRARSWGIGIGGSVREASPSREPAGSPSASSAMVSRQLGFWIASTWSRAIVNGVRIDEAATARRCPPAARSTLPGAVSDLEDRRLHGLQAVERGGEVAEERSGIVVPGIQADPGLPRLAGLHPLAEQGRLPVPGRSDHGDDRGIRGQQPPDQGGAGNEPGPAPRRAQLGLEQLRFQPERRRAPPRGRAERPNGRAGRHGHGG